MTQNIAWSEEVWSAEHDNPIYDYPATGSLSPWSPGWQPEQPATLVAPVFLVEDDTPAPPAPPGRTSWWCSWCPW